MYVMKREHETHLGIVIQTMHADGTWAIATAKPKLFPKKIKMFGAWMEKVNKKKGSNK